MIARADRGGPADAPEALGILLLAGLQVEADDESDLGDEVGVAPVGERAGMLADRLLPLPHRLERRLVALLQSHAAVRLGGGGAVRLHPVLARADQDQIAAHGRRRDVVADESVERGEELAAGRVVGVERAAAADEDGGLAGDLAHDRRSPRPPALAVGLPLVLPRGLVQRDEVRRPEVIDQDHDGLLGLRRGTADAVAVLERAVVLRERPLPLHLTGVGQRDHVAGLEEGVDGFLVYDRRGRGPAHHRVVLALLVGGELLLPRHLAGLHVHTGDEEFLFLIAVDGGHEGAVAPDHGRRLAVAG